TPATPAEPISSLLTSAKTAMLFRWWTSWPPSRSTCGHRKRITRSCGRISLACERGRNASLFLRGQGGGRHAQELYAEKAAGSVKLETEGGLPQHRAGPALVFERIVDHEPLAAVREGL